MALNITQFSDLHYSSNTSKEKMKDIKGIDSDYTFFTGDLLNSTNFVKTSTSGKEYLLR